LLTITAIGRSSYGFCNISRNLAMLSAILRASSRERIVFSFEHLAARLQKLHCGWWPKNTQIW
jgi:hypothetical protein